MKENVFDVLERIFVYVIITLLFVGLITGMFAVIFSESQDHKEMLDFCHAEGYDGFKDNCGFGCEEIVCFKSVNGYEEISNPIALQR